MIGVVSIILVPCGLHRISLRASVGIRTANAESIKILERMSSAMRSRFTA
jgi:hypothetical protein